MSDEFLAELLQKQRLRWYNNSNVPKLYNETATKKLDLYPYPEDYSVFKELADIKSDINKFVSEGGCLYIWSSSVGNGKTTWAVKLLKAYLYSIKSLPFDYENYCPVLFVNVSEYLETSKRAIRDKSLEKTITDIENKIYSADLVIFDDIADKTISEYDMNKLYCWVNYRTSNLKSCIYTSNMSPTELGTCLSAKLCSRIVDLSVCKEIKTKYSGRGPIVNVSNNSVSSN